jgi:hypothetical protein
MWVLLILASMLLAIVALAGPAWVAAGRVAIRLDDRPGVFAADPQSPSRDMATVADIQIWAAERGVEIATGESAGVVEALVTDDVTLAATPDRVPVLPRTAVHNAGVSRIAFANGQAMVRIVNRRSTPIDRLTVKYDGTPREVEVEPIAADSSADRFVDVGGAPEVVEIAIPAGDGFPADDVARLVRVPGGANLVVGADVPASVRRFATAYTAARGVGSRSVLVTRDATFAGDAVFLARTSERVGAVTSVRHELLDGVRLPDRAQAPIDLPPNAGWTVIVQAGDAPMIAVRSSPARQVWLAMAFDDLAVSQSIDFTILLTNAFDFVAGSRAATMTSSLASATLRAGFADQDGVRVAVNQPFVDTTIVRADESWRDELASRVDATRSRRSFATPLFVAASLLAAAAVFLR